MKKLNKILFLMAILPFLFITSCKDEDPAPATDNFSVLADYLVAQNLDLDDMLASWITYPVDADGIRLPASDVPAWTANFYVMDIRGADDFNTSHIDGAVNTTLGTIVDDAASATAPILVVCYTGQTASHATIALRLSGYTNAKVLKWGMSGWRADLAGSWEANSGATNGVYGIGHNNWTAAPGSTTALENFDYPTFTTSSTDPEAILAERVTYMTTTGFQGVSSHDVIDTPAGYQINNYWAQTDVEHYGHIAEAYRINPLTLEGDLFKHYDPSATVVTYCWTGQTSSMVTAYLTVLGYNAKSLKFGVNSLIYSDLESHKFVTPGEDFPVVTN